MPEQAASGRLAQAFAQAEQKLLSIFFTAGYPNLDDTVSIAQALEESGADMLEIGIPFSDPLADGPTIQASSEQALANGMTLATLFDQLEMLRPAVSIPVLLMGYLNPILQYGVEAFCERCAEVGVDGVILPDLPLPLYLKSYKDTFERHGLKVVWLVTPRTSDERMREIDGHATGFLYVVSSFAVTGNQLAVDQQKQDYFARVHALDLQSPLMVGFGIYDAESFARSTALADGGIIGSAFLKAIADVPSEQMNETIKAFIAGIRA